MMDGDRRSVREVPQSVSLSAGRDSTFWQLFFPAHMEIASGIRKFSPDWLSGCNELGWVSPNHQIGRTHMSWTA
jgi:hypothetical protein